MPILLQLKDAHKTYGMQVLLDGAEMAMTDTNNVGLIGRNGCGKSTLCRILLGEEDLDSGQIIRHPNLRLGYLTQHDPFEGTESALEFLMRDSGQPEWRCGEYAGRFNIKDEMLNGPVTKLSGGWQTRVKIASLLLHDPNLLILDEPTNFLDLRTQMLLEEFLKEFRSACLVVSHDRTFLKDTCNQTLELSRGVLDMYNGDIDSFLTYKEEKIEHDMRANVAIASKQRQLKTFIDKNRAGANTASQARSKAKQLDKLQLNKIAADEKKVRMRIPIIEPRQGVALRVIDLSIGYPEHTVATDINLEFEHGMRLAIVGDNGQGKTTFLRTVVESLPTLGGAFKWGHGCDIGCYAQHVYTTLPMNYSIVDYLGSCALAGTTKQELLNLAGSFLFSGDDVEKKIEVLSGGERARVCLASLLLGKHNVLILDEPVNHLDVETVGVLAEALKRYQGTVIFTSHDRHFMHTVATEVVEVRHGSVKAYSGSYDEYLYRIGKEIKDGLRATSSKGSENKGKGKGKELTKEERKVLARKRYDLGRDLQATERKIAKYEKLKSELDALLPNLSDPKEAQNKSNEREKASTILATAEADWLKFQEAIEKLDAK